MTTSRQEFPNTDQLWAGEIKVTVHVAKELTADEERQLAVRFRELTEELKVLARHVLPSDCRVDISVG